MRRNVRYQYKQLLSETDNEGSAAGWCEEELRRAKNKLKSAREAELEKLREGCYMVILEEYTEF